MKTEAKAVNSFQFKGNKLQFEFNSSLLDFINSACASLLEAGLTRVSQELENTKTSLNKRKKAVRFADKSPDGWTAVEEYESDELANDSDDEKKGTFQASRTKAKSQYFSNPLKISQAAGSYRSDGQPAFRPQ